MKIVTVREVQCAVGTQVPSGGQRYLWPEARVDATSTSANWGAEPSHDQVEGTLPHAALAIERLVESSCAISVA